jgi:hypothetical protein
VNIAELEAQRRFPVDIDGQKLSVYQDYLLTQVAKAAGGESAKDAMAFRVYVGNKTRVILRLAGKDLYRDITDAQRRECPADYDLEMRAVKELSGEIAAP